MARALYAALALLVACGTAEEDFAQARRLIGVREYTQAIESCQRGLGRAPNEAVAWGLRLALLEAKSRLGDGDGTLRELEALAAAHPERLSSSLFLATAAALEIAGERAARLTVLDMGAKRFPADPGFATVIARSKTQADPQELELLRSLGYVD
jgi:hypothetical protein